MLEILRAPLLAADIPMKLTTYTFKDPESPQLKMILVADIDRSLNPAGTVSLGYMLMDDKGKIVSSELERVVPNPIDPRTKTQKYIGAAIAPPGTYTLKVAVVDDGGKRGSVERTFVAQINGFGQLHATDLLIADNTARGSSGGLPPAVAADFTGDELHAYLELFSEVPEQLRSATVVLDVAQTESSASLNSAAARFQQAAVASNPPGGARHRADRAPAPRRVCRARDHLGRRAQGRPGRAAVPCGAPRRRSLTAPGASSALVKPATPIPFSSRIDAFDKAAVLTPQVVGFFLDRLSATAAASAAAVQPALASVRAGRFDEAMTALERAGDDQLAAVFLKGLVLLQRGDLNAAAANFRDGAANGLRVLCRGVLPRRVLRRRRQDREAAGAWQTSLITESNAPFVYTLLGDALLRMRSIDQAIDILTEARTLWPADDQVSLRLGTALMMANRSAEALKVLEPYLAAHPADHERLFLALRALYEARSARARIGHRRQRQSAVHPLRRRLRAGQGTTAGAGGPVAQILR